MVGWCVLGWIRVGVGQMGEYVVGVFGGFVEEVEWRFEVEE